MKKQKFPFYLLFIIPLMLYSSTITQDSWEVFKHVGLAYGDDGAMQIFEDSKGNIWFLTIKNGVMKYDGTNLTNYTESNGLVSNKIFRYTVSRNVQIYEDSSGIIWLGSKKGLMRYNGNSFEVISKNDACRIIEDSYGNIWFGIGTLTDGSGGGFPPITGGQLSSFDGENVFLYSKEKNQLPDNYIRFFIYDKVKNTMWISGYRSGLSSFNGEKWQIHNKEPGAPTNRIRTILTDDNGILWAGTKKGVYCYDGTSWTHYSVEHGLIPDNVLELHKDSNNRIWAITGEHPKTGGVLPAGISALSKSGLSVFYDGTWHPFEEESNIPDNLVMNIFETSKGEFWFDTYVNVKGFYRYDGSKWYEFKRNNEFKANHFHRIYEDSKGNVWFGLGAISGAGIEKFTGKPHVGINRLKGIGKFDGTEWTFFNEDTGLPSNVIFSILEDSKGNMWFGSSKGILRYSP